MAKRSSAYWKKRFLEIEKASNAYGVDAFRQIEPSFDSAQRQIQREIESWYARYAKNNNISMQEARRQLSTKELKEFRWDVNEYIKYGRENALNGQWMKELENASARVHVSRLEALKIRIQHAAEVAFGNELDMLDGMARKVYTEDYYKSIFAVHQGFGLGWNIGQIDERKLNTLIAKPWTADNKTFKDRIWNSKTAMVSELHQQMTRMCLLGKAPDEAINAMTKFVDKKFKNAKYVAGRLVMTEQAYFHSVAQKSAFEDLDVEEFEVVATLDNHTSEICQDLDGQHFPMKDYEPGVTAPPFHVWCRSVTVPYFEDNYTGERAARNEEGQTYYVPDDMTYKDWKNSFVNGNTAGLKPVDNINDMKDDLDFSSRTLQELKDEIIKRHDAILKTDVEKMELSGIIDGMTAEKVNLYEKLSEVFPQNHYYDKGTGWYSPWKKQIQMDMRSNTWDNRVGRSVQGAWKTKFHEEMHQLDHMLSKKKSKFALIDGTPDQYVFDAFTSTRTAYGKRMIKAIDDDIVDLINQAVDWDLKTNGVVAKPIKNLGRIPREAKDALIRYLKVNYPDGKDKALIDTVTDAIGMTTSGKIHPYSNGFWGHKLSYCKQSGKDGATSEAWANLAGFMLRGDTEALDAVRKLMPGTVSTYQDIFDEVIEYAKTETISYTP